MATTPDIGVRLSAQGVEKVIAALKKVQAEARATGKAGRDGGGGFGLLNSALSDMRGLLPQLGIAAAVTGIVSLAKSALDTADAMDEASQKTAFSVETLSALATLPDAAGEGFDRLTGGLVRFNRFLGEVANGSKEAKTSVDTLLGSQDALSGLDTEQAFFKVATALAQLPEGYQKVALATKIFGKSGAELLPLLNDLAQKGFPAVREEADRMGLLLSSEMAAAAAQTKDNMDRMSRSVQGAAMQFMAGLAPAIESISTGLLNGNENAAGMREGLQSLGAVAGFVGRLIASVFVLVGNSVGTALRAVWDMVAAIGAAGKALISLKNPLKAFGVRMSEGDQVLSANLDATASQLRSLWSSSGTLATPKTGKAAGDDEADQREKERQRRAAQLARERAAKERERQRAELAKAQEELRKAWRENEAKLAAAREQAQEASDKRIYDKDPAYLETYFDNRAKALEAGYAREQDLLEKHLEDLQRQQAEALGKGDEAAARRVEKAIQEAEAQKKLNAISIDTARADLAGDRASALESRRAGGVSAGINDYQFGLAQMSLERDQIQNQVTAGQISEEQGVQRILALERERIPILRAQLLAMREREGLTREEILAIDQSIASLDGMAAANMRATDSASQLKATFAGIAFQQLNTFFTQTIFNAKSAGDAFKQFGMAALSAIQQVLTQMVLLAAFRAMGMPMSGGVGGIGFAFAAEGGVVTGGVPGRDSVPVMTMPGEGILRTSAMRRIGVERFHALNAGRAVVIPTSHLPRFADGGVVGAASPGSALEAAQAGGDWSGTLRLDRGLILDELRSPAARRIQFEHLSKHPKEANQNLGRK